METIEAVVGEGGVLHIEGLPFEAGRRVEVKPVADPTPMTQEEWVAFVDCHYGALADTDFDVPEDSPPSEIEPLW